MLLGVVCSDKGGFSFGRLGRRTDGTIGCFGLAFGSLIVGLGGGGKCVQRFGNKHQALVAMG